MHFHNYVSVCASKIVDKLWFLFYSFKHANTVPPRPRPWFLQPRHRLALSLKARQLERLVAPGHARMGNAGVWSAIPCRMLVLGDRYLGVKRGDLLNIFEAWAIDGNNWTINTIPAIQQRPHLKRKVRFEFVSSTNPNRSQVQTCPNPHESHGQKQLGSHVAKTQLKPTLTTLSQGLTS